MSKHTPGPWGIDRKNWPFEMTGRYHRILNGDRFPTAFIPAWSEPGPGEIDGTEEAKANARLISCAPELLEALRICCEYIEAEGIEPPGNARAIIAKAEGHD